MSTSQTRAIAAHRRRLRERGLARYEVRGLEQDKQLVRKLAKRLAESDSEAARLLRATLEEQLGEEPLSCRRIWAALRSSPLVGIDLDLERELVPPRDVDL